MLMLKAQQEQPQIEAQAKSLATDPPQANAQAGAADAQKTMQQLQAMQESMKKAVELGPQARRAAQEAGKHLADQEAEQAIPKQEQALKLLKEISESLPKKDSSEQQQGNKNEQDNQDKQDSKDERKSQDSPGQQQDREQQNQPSSKQLSRQQAMSVLRRAKERERKHRQTQKQLQRFLTSPIHVDRDW